MDAMIAGREHTDGARTERTTVLSKVLFVHRHLLHFRDVAVVDGDFGLHKLKEPGIELRRPHRLRQASEEELLRTAASGCIGTSGWLRQQLAGGDRVAALAH